MDSTLSKCNNNMWEIYVGNSLCDRRLIIIDIIVDCDIVLVKYRQIDKYAYCPVNVSRAVGPRCVDRAINNLSNDLEI